MAEHHAACLKMLTALVEGLIGADGLLDALRKTTGQLTVKEQRIAEHIGLKLFHGFILELEAFRHGDDGVALATDIAVADNLVDLLEAHGEFGDEHKVRIRCNACLQGDPAGVAAHAFHHEAACVGSGGGVQAVDLLGGDVGCGVKAEGPVGAGEVVVDGLGHADHIHAKLAKLIGDAKGIVTADGNKAFKAKGFHGGVNDLGAVFDFHYIGAGAAENGAALGLDAFHFLGGHPVTVALNDATPACVEAEYFDAFLQAAGHNAADHSVQAGAVSAAGQDTDLSHDLFPP